MTIESVVSKNILIEKNISVVMRDGVILYADVYRPGDEGKYPILLMRTPYNKEDAQTMNYAHPIWYAKRGFVVIAQDTRGRFTSQGEFHPYAHEAEDGYDTIEWAAKLPNVIPKVGLYGFSYVGTSQLLTAAARPPHLTCIAPGMSGSDSFQGRTYQNGAFALALNLTWALFVSGDRAARKERWEWVREIANAPIQQLYQSLPLSEVPVIKKELAPFYEEWLHHPTRNEYWKDTSPKEVYKNIHVPALHIGGWYDIFIEGTIENFLGIKEQSDSTHAKENQYLYLTPWYHMPWSRYVGELDFGEEAINRIDQLQLQWFNKWLKGGENEWKTPSVQYFLMGENRWNVAEEWPPEEIEEQVLYLASEGRANSINGDGLLSVEEPKEMSEEDVYVYHPSIPVPALGGRSGADPVLTPMGPKNQIPIEVRNDLLVYTSKPLKKDLEVAGEITVVLYASTTVEDTDFVVKLIDVYPDGRAFNLAEGILRASYRNSLSHPTPVIPGEVVRYEVKAGSVANVFKKGHSIRVDVTSSLFPTFDRHSNQFKYSGLVHEADFRAATQTIFHCKKYPSHLKLPVKNQSNLLIF